MFRLELPKVLELNKLNGSCSKLYGSRLMLMMLLEVVLGGGIFMRVHTHTQVYE